MILMGGVKLNIMIQKMTKTGGPGGVDKHFDDKGQILRM